MFDLESAIEDWRRQMQAGGIKSPVPMDELEEHLRKDFRALLSAGEPEARAFHQAVARLGNTGSLQVEFNKIKGGHIWPVKIGSVLWLGGVIVAAAFLSGRLINGRLDLVLFAHILSVIAGYCAVFLMGWLGVYYVCVRRFHRLSPVKQRSLDRASHLFSQLIVGLVIVAVLLGMPISKRLFGTYWLWDLKLIGALCVIAWFGALVAMQRLGRTSDRAAMLMCIGGNVIVSLAWFGANMVDNARLSHSHGRPLALAVFVLINFGFLALGMLPAQKSTAS